MLKIVQKLSIQFNDKKYEELLLLLLEVEKLIHNNTHQIRRQIDDIFYLYEKQRWDDMNIVIKNLLGLETGNYKLNNFENVMSLKTYCKIK